MPFNPALSEVVTWKTRPPVEPKLVFQSPPGKWSKLCCKFENCTLGVRHMTEGPLEPILGPEEKKLKHWKQPNYPGTLIVAPCNPLSDVPEPHRWKERNTYDKLFFVVIFFSLIKKHRSPWKKKKNTIGPTHLQNFDQKNCHKWRPPPKVRPRKNSSPLVKGKKNLDKKKNKNNFAHNLEFGLPVFMNREANRGPNFFHPTIFTSPLRTTLVTSDNGYRPSQRDRSVSNRTRYLNSPGCNRRISHRMV